MANTLFDHGAKYHFRDVKITQNHATMKDTGHHKRKASNLELLQEDYRSRLLHEREQKANALFEQKVRAELLPKKGSVREFFLNRRMLAASITETSNGVNLPPIKRNTRYKGKQKDQTKHVDGTKEKMETSTFSKDIETQEDCNLTELEKLRKKHRKSKTTKHQQTVSSMNMAKNSFSPSCPSTYGKNEANTSNRNAPLPKARGVKSREVYKRGTRPSHATNEEGHSERNSQDLESSFAAGNKMTKATRGVKSREVYKRGRRPSEESNTETNTKHLASFLTESDIVSKSLVRIKELVNRRRTEELILRSKTRKLTAQSQTPSPRRNSQSFDEMCKVEIELRETISREEKKLLALRERRRQTAAGFTNEIRTSNETGWKVEQPKETKQNTPAEYRDEKTTKSVRKSKEENRQNAEHTRLNLKKSKQNCAYGVIDKEKNAEQLQQRKKQQKTRSTKLQPKQEKHFNSAVGTMDLVTCSNCGRGFMKERIAKHEKACKKASARIKKPFDAKRKRAEGTDMEKYIIVGKRDDSIYKENKRDWKRAHENFIQSIRSARLHETQATTPLSNPDYIECSYCQRKFKSSVAETHIPRCKDIKARPRPPRR